MALSLEPERLMAEKRAQERARDDRIAGSYDIVRQYVGAWWDGPPGPDSDFDSENASFEYLSSAVAQMVWENPRWRCTSRRPRAQAMVAQAIESGLNRWTLDTDPKTVWEDIVVDFGILYGVTLCSLAPRVEHYESEDPPLWPQLSRISPADFGFDNRAPSYRRSRMLWHEYRIDKNDLIEQAERDRELHRSKRQGWILDNVRELQTTSDWQAGTQRSPMWRALAGQEPEPDREQVRVLEVHLPGHRLDGKPGPEDGFNGTTLSLGLGGSGGHAIMLRPPRPYFGPRWGPYTLYGCYVVPDCPYPLSPLMAAAGNITQASRISKAVDRQVEAYKRLILVGAQDPQLAANIKAGKNEHIYMARQIEDLDRMVRQLEMGGTTPGNVAAEQRAIGKRNRILGLDEVQRGVVSGEGTATEVQLAVEASLGRQGYVRSRFQRACRQDGRTVSWYLYHTDEIAFPLGAETLEQLGIPEEFEATFEGGRNRPGDGATYDDLQLEIEAYSMERQSEALLQRRGQFLTTLVQLLPAIVQARQLGADSRGLLDAIGDSFGMPKLSQLFPGIESADLSQIQPIEAQPRIGRELGARGLAQSFRPALSAQAPAQGVQRGPSPVQFKSALTSAS